MKNLKTFESFVDEVKKVDYKIWDQYGKKEADILIYDTDGKYVRVLPRMSMAKAISYLEAGLEAGAELTQHAKGPYEEFVATWKYNSGWAKNKDVNPGLKAGKKAEVEYKVKLV
jgi:hypothetical protein